MLALPREVNLHPETGKPILAGMGRFGPWVRHWETLASIGEDDQVLTVGVNRAVALIAEKEIWRSRMRGPKRMLRELGKHPGDGAPVWLKTGHYGPFVAHRRTYASMPKDIPLEELTLEQGGGSPRPPDRAPTSGPEAQAEKRGGTAKVLTRFLTAPKPGRSAGCGADADWRVQVGFRDSVGLGNAGRASGGEARCTGTGAVAGITCCRSVAGRLREAVA